MFHFSSKSLTPNFFFRSKTCTQCICFSILNYNKFQTKLEDFLGKVKLLFKDIM